MFAVTTIARPEEELRRDIVNLFTALSVGAEPSPIVLETYRDEKMNTYHLIARAELDEEDGHKSLIFVIVLQADAFDFEGTQEIRNRDFYNTEVNGDAVYDCFRKAIEKQRSAINEDAERFNWRL